MDQQPGDDMAARLERLEQAYRRLERAYRRLVRFGGLGLAGLTVAAVCGASYVDVARSIEAESFVLATERM